MTDTVSISKADIADLERLYAFRGSAEVVQFLEQYPFLVPTLLAAPNKIKHYFPDSQLFLEVVPDVDIPDWIQLCLDTI